jgi:serine/threonine protein kinase
MPNTDPPPPPPASRWLQEAATVPPDPDGTRAFLPSDSGSPTLVGELPREFGRYLVEKLLGRGGMGAVYLAQDTRLGRRVALKVPTLTGHSAEATRARFLREAQSAAALLHPNICPIHDLGDIDGIPYLTMPFLQGETLSQRVGPGCLFAPRAAAELVRKIALALQAAHEHGVIHRDLKPANIMIDERSEPVVMDFGLARREDVALLTQQGEVMGTPAYMPPEQITGDVAAVGPASDVYSLGVVLYELLTGRPPFQGDLLALVSQVTLDEPTPPSQRRPSLDRRFDAICLRCLAKRPADRWLSMRDLACALEEFLDPPPLLTAGGPDSTAERGAPLTLRIAGTSFAYRPLPGQDVITIGRQKRKLGDPPDHGNDLVLRVLGNDQLSGRISRRHCEIRRQDGGFVILDRSKVGLTKNGQPLPHGVPVPLAAGDQLVLAGIIALEVLLHKGAAAGPTRTTVEVGQGDGNAPVILEATLGDMMTME